MIFLNVLTGELIESDKKKIKAHIAIDLKGLGKATDNKTVLFDPRERGYAVCWEIWHRDKYNNLDYRGYYNVPVKYRTHPSFIATCTLAKLNG